MGRGRGRPFSISRPVSPGDAVRRMTAVARTPPPGARSDPEGGAAAVRGVCRRRGPEGRHRSPPAAAPRLPPRRRGRMEAGARAGLRAPGGARPRPDPRCGAQPARHPLTQWAARPQPRFSSEPHSPLRGGSPRRGADPLLVVVAPGARWAGGPAGRGGALRSVFLRQPRQRYSLHIAANGQSGHDAAQAPPELTQCAGGGGGRTAPRRRRGPSRGPGAAPAPTSDNSAVSALLEPQREAVGGERRSAPSAVLGPALCSATAGAGT